MKLACLLVASSCPCALSSTASLHSKNVFNDDDEKTHFEIGGYQPLHATAGSPKLLHPLSHQRQIDTSIPTWSPTFETADVIYGSTGSPTPAATTTVAASVTLSPTPEIELDETISSPTPTVAYYKTMYPTDDEIGDDGYIYTTEVEDNSILAVDDDDDMPHVPNWDPYTTLTSEQLSQCQSDLSASDTDQDMRLNYTEYLHFLSVNSARYGYSNNNSSINDEDMTLHSFPYEMTLIYHSTSCLCAYFGEGEGCCLGDNQGVRIVDSVDDVIVVDENETMVDGNTTTDTTVNSTQTPLDYEALSWNDLPSSIRDAYTILGYDAISWEEGYPVPDSEYRLWNELNEEMQNAALEIGYSQDSWDSGRRLRLLGLSSSSFKYNNAKEIFGRIIVGGNNETGGVDTGVDTVGNETDSAADASSSGGASNSLSGLLDGESYTRNFCTDVYNAYKVTKSPTYAPTEGEVTESPSPAPSSLTTLAPFDSVPTSAAPVASGESSAPVAGVETTAPIVSGGSATPTYLPTEGDSNPPVASPTSLPPVGGTPMPNDVSPPTNPPVTLATPAPSLGDTVVSTPAPSSPSNDDFYSIFLQYGISSNCGVTAVDVLDANENTIVEGLIAATEVLVVDILNTTFPRADSRLKDGHKLFRGTFDVYVDNKEEENEEMSQAEMVLTKFFVDNDLTMVKEQSGEYLEMTQGPIKTSAGNMHKQAKKQMRQSKQNNDRRLAHIPKEKSNQHRRKLVYWTPMYPIEITDVEDVLDQACPVGINCMKVFTTVKVVLEEGDDALAVEEAIKTGVQAAFADGTFFQAIPPETIFCPGDTAPPVISTNPPVTAPTATAEPTVGSTTAETDIATNAPQLANTPAPTVTSVESSEPTVADVTSSNEPTTADVSSSAPTAASTDASDSSAPPTTGDVDSTNQPSVGSTAEAESTSPSAGEAASTNVPTAGEVTSTNKPTSGATNVPPWALPDDTESPSAAGQESVPTFSPTSEEPETATLSPVASTTAAPSSGGNNLLVEVTYDIANDCGVDSQAVMDEVDNTLKTGLIAATAATTIDILNTTYPRTDNGRRQLKQQNVYNLRHSGDRNLVQLKNDLRHTVDPDHRHLVYYTDELPVTMDNVIDVTEDCPVGSNCLLIISTITTVLEEGDNPDEVKKALEDGIRESFTDGSFYANIPSDTVICPGERRKLAGRLRFL